jgi:hypothetical protein
VMYDRLLQHGRFADRPVASGGPDQMTPPPAGHGAPRFRRTVPDWLAPDCAVPDGTDGIIPDGTDA